MSLRSVVYCSSLILYLTDFNTIKKSKKFENEPVSVGERICNALGYIPWHLNIKFFKLNEKPAHHMENISNSNCMYSRAQKDWIKICLEPFTYVCLRTPETAVLTPLIWNPKSRQSELFFDIFLFNMTIDMLSLYRF